MKLVGATSGFIRKPFLWYNVVSGIWAAVLAIMMLAGTLYYLQAELGVFVNLLAMDMLLIVFAVVLILGILISFIATYFAVNKYLKMSVDKLYYI